MWTFSKAFFEKIIIVLAWSYETEINTQITVNANVDPEQWPNNFSIQIEWISVATSWLNHRTNLYYIYFATYRACSCCCSRSKGHQQFAMNFYCTAHPVFNTKYALRYSFVACSCRSSLVSCLLFAYRRRIACIVFRRFCWNYRRIDKPSELFVYAHVAEFLLTAGCVWIKWNAVLFVRISTNLSVIGCTKSKIWNSTTFRICFFIFKF